jgi:hypothetical protein
VQQFIMTDGFSSVDIKQQTREAIVRSQDDHNLAAKLFISAQREVLEQLEREIFPHYLLSAHYRAWTRNSGGSRRTVK